MDGVVEGVLPAPARTAIAPAASVAARVPVAATTLVPRARTALVPAARTALPVRPAALLMAVGTVTSALLRADAGAHAADFAGGAFDA
jgi:hypothetical protein